MLGSQIANLLLQKAISPIGGIDEEWVNVAEENGLPLFQNNRCGAIFKNGSDGKPYYLDAIVFKEEDGNTFTSNFPIGGVISRQFIKSFPFVPKTFYVDVVTVGDDHNVKDLEQLDKVSKYYQIA